MVGVIKKKEDVDVYFPVRLCQLILNVPKTFGNMMKQFKIVVDIYGIPDKEGVSKIIKKNVIKNKVINLHDVTSIEELCNERGKVLKGMCAIECGERQIVVKGKYQDIYKMLTTFNCKPVGFRYKNRI